MRGRGCTRSGACDDQLDSRRQMQVFRVHVGDRAEPTTSNASTAWSFWRQGCSWPEADVADRRTDGAGVADEPGSLAAKFTVRHDTTSPRFPVNAVCGDAVTRARLAARRTGPASAPPGASGRPGRRAVRTRRALARFPRPLAATAAGAGCTRRWPSSSRRRRAW